MTISVDFDVEPDESVSHWDDTAMSNHLRELSVRIGTLVAPHGGMTEVIHTPSLRPQISPPTANVRVSIPEAGDSIVGAFETGARIAAVLAGAGYSVSSAQVVDWQYVVVLA